MQPLALGVILPLADRMGIKMTAYLVLDFSVRDLPEFRTYISSIPAFIEKHGGRYIVRGVEPAVMEGDWRPDHMVILEFPSSQAAKDFLGDPEAQELFAVRHRSTDSKLVLVEGCV